VNADTPWLTVVTVVKDDLAGFNKSLTSLLEQDNSGVEYVVIDSSGDPSVVESATLGSGFEDFKVEWSLPAGIYPAMNKGLELARGEYIYFLNAGDSFIDNGVLANLRKLVRSTSPVWVVGLVKILELGGKTVISSVWDYEEQKHKLFADGLFPPHQGTVVRTEVLRSVGGFDVRYKIAADYAAALSLTKVADPIMTDYVIAVFVEGGVSTNKWKESFREFHEARREILAPRGLAAMFELVNYWKHFAKVFVLRSIRR